MRIRDVLAAKADPVVLTVAPDLSVRDLLARLAEHNVGALVVSGDGDTLDGIVSERDVVRHLHDDPEGLSSNVRTIMTTEVHTCPPDADLDDLMTAMTERRIRHVPVLDGGRMVGLVSIGDVVKHKISSLQFERDQLDHYVHQT
jgi:CBS domain-containing protein